jgi:hypothetical protein
MGALDPKFSNGFKLGGEVALESILAVYEERLASAPDDIISLADLVAELKNAVPMVRLAVDFSESALSAGLRPQDVQAQLADADDEQLAAWIEATRRARS